MNSWLPLRWLLTLSVAALWSPLAAHAFLYRADPIEAWVVDAETGRPVEGALVTANWQLEGGLDSGIPRGQLQILETTTDAAGRFYFPGWGPKFAFIGHASWKWPQILVFKPGYRYARVMNEPATGQENTAKSDWHGKKTNLSRLPDTATYLSEYRSFNREIDWIGRSSGDECTWRRLPETLRALTAEDARLRSLGFKNFGSFIGTLQDNDDAFVKKGCGSAKEFLEGLRK